jgi:coenzyme F420-0:L-glutamate ligase/coenzyme F420-1:gamma-L-glutamate ligase
MPGRETYPLTVSPLIGLPLIKRGDNLPELIWRSLNHNQLKLRDGDILVLAQKIVSKAEGRVVDLKTIKPSQSAQEWAQKTEKDPRLIELILQESKEVLRYRPGTIIVEHKLGFVCANAGIDRSNVSGGKSEQVLLLPENPDRSAAKIRSDLETFSDTKLGVVIIDSHGRAWRKGTVGIAIGFSGLPGVVDLRGDQDLFGYKLQVSEVAAVDEVAAAASLVMGQADEGTPAVHVRGFPYLMREGSFSELPREKESDLFR